MHIKIDLNKYFIFSLSLTFCLFLFARGLNEIAAIFIIYLATLLNHLLLVKFVREITGLYRSKVRFENPFRKYLLRERPVILFVLKSLSIIFGIFLGVHLMAERVIIPVLNYIFQIFILIISLKTEVVAK